MRTSSPYGRRSSTPNVWVMFLSLLPKIFANFWQLCFNKNIEIFVSPALAGKTHRDHFVPCCCCCLLWKQLKNRLKFDSNFTCFNGFQPKLGHRCNMETLICWWVQRSHIMVKGHLRSSWKMGWKCESGLIWKVEVRFEPNLVYWQNMGTFVCSCGQRSQIKVKGHLRSTCKITWKCNFDLFAYLRTN